MKRGSAEWVTAFVPNIQRSWSLSFLTKILKNVNFQPAAGAKSKIDQNC